MIRLKLVRVFQSGVLGPIRVYKRARPADAPKPLLDPEQRAEAQKHEADHTTMPQARLGSRDSAQQTAGSGSPAADSEARAADSGSLAADSDKIH